MKHKAGRVMGNGIDSIINLLLIVAAGLVFWRLRSVLGRRTGEERPHYDPYTRPSSGTDDKVVPLPGRAVPKDKNPDTARQNHVTSFVSAGSPAAQGLTEICLADQDFDPESFLSGSKVAYEMVVVAFAKGDRDTLQPLLSDSVYQSFDREITRREEDDLSVEMSFIGLESADIREASLSGSLARLTVRFVSEMISVTKREDGVVVEGDPVTVREIKDIWTFERDVKNQDPNWRVVKTEAET